MKNVKKNIHQTELRSHPTKRSFCAEPKCRFFGQLAEQGICFSKLDSVTEAYISATMKSSEAMLESLRALRKQNLAASNLTTDKAWIQYLEGQLVCVWANSEFGLNELVYLRAENAKLRAQLGKKQRAR